MIPGFKQWSERMGDMEQSLTKDIVGVSRENKSKNQGGHSFSLHDSQCDKHFRSTRQRETTHNIFSGNTFTFMP